MSLDGDPLALPAMEMRRIGYATVDALVALIGERPPVIQQATPAQMRERLGGPPPEQPQGFDAALARMVRDVAPFRSHVTHPGYFAYIPGSQTWPGVMGDLVASALNVDVGNWMESAGPSQVELEVLDWFREWIGFPEGAGGVLVSGGSAANLTALACARELRLGAMTPDAVAYCSDQSHSSIGRAARALGFRPDQLRVLPTDERYRMRVDALESAIASDLAAGRVPLVVAANAGATNTGAVDPLPELAEVCRRHGVWLHVDAAYGGFAVLTDRGRERLRGIELADSVTLDPHKWLYQPFECGAILVRERGALERAFSVSPDYLADTAGADAEVNFAARGLQLTRTSHAFKVWMSIQSLGLGAFRAAIDRCLDLAGLAEALVRADDRLELMMPATLGIVCFRRRVPGARTESEVAAVNLAAMAALADSGVGMVSSTRLHGHTAIRLCVLNHASDEDDVRAVLDLLASAPVEVPVSVPVPVPAGEAGAARGDSSAGTRSADASGLSLAGRELDADRLPVAAPMPSDGAAGLAAVIAHPLVLALSPSGRDAVVEGGQHVVVPTGEAVTTRWASDRDFYLVLRGCLRVEVDGALVRELEDGEFFGELAARDWGSGFGYPRLATVVAAETSQLWRLPPELFGELAATEPRFAARVADAVRERFARS